MICVTNQPTNQLVLQSLLEILGAQELVPNQSQEPTKNSPKTLGDSRQFGHWNSRSCEAWDEWGAWFSSLLGLYHRRSSRPVDGFLGTNFFFGPKSQEEIHAKTGNPWLKEGPCTGTHLTLTHIYYWSVLIIESYSWHSTPPNNSILPNQRFWRSFHIWSHLKMCWLYKHLPTFTIWYAFQNQRCQEFSKQIYTPGTLT